MRICSFVNGRTECELFQNREKGVVKDYMHSRAKEGEGGGEGERHGTVRKINCVSVRRTNAAILTMSFFI